MAITSPQCGHQYDSTLFVFGRTVHCDCDYRFDISEGHLQKMPMPIEGVLIDITEVSLGNAGAVLALEASLLARSSVDWHRLIEICGIAGTILIDEDGCYDPSDFNDGLLLHIDRHQSRTIRSLGPPLVNWSGSSVILTTTSV